MNAFYMAPETAQALLAKSREYTAAKREEKALKARQAREFDAALSQLMRLKWPEEAARELAALKVYGVMA